MTAPEPVFKGWAKPGPIPPGALTGEPATAPGETLDAISGHFRIFQPATRNVQHRPSDKHYVSLWNIVASDENRRNSSQYNYFFHFDSRYVRMRL